MPGMSAMRSSQSAVERVVAVGDWAAKALWKNRTGKV
jgi:hypothetical protein